MPGTMNRIPLTCLGSTLNFELCQPATCNALPRGCLEAHRRRPEAVVLGGLWEWHSGCLDCYLFGWLYWIVILRYSEASRYSGRMLISLSLLPAYKLPSARIGPWPITLQSMSIPHSQRVSCTKPTSNIVQQSIVFSMSCFLVVVWQRKPRNFSAGRQTSTWAPILRSPTDSFSFAPSKSRQLAARKGGHASVASVLGGHEETPWKDFDLNLRNPWQLGLTVQRSTGKRGHFLMFPDCFLSQLDQSLWEAALASALLLAAARCAEPDPKHSKLGELPEVKIWVGEIDQSGATLQSIENTKIWVIWAWNMHDGKKNQLQLQMVQPFNLICLGLSTWTSATWYLCPGDTTAKQKCWVHWSLSASLRLLWLGGFRLAMGPWTVHRKSRMFRTSFRCHFDKDEALCLEEVIVPAKQYGMDRVADDTRWSPLQIPALSYIFTIQHFLDISLFHQFFFTIQGHEIQITCRSMWESARAPLRWQVKTWARLLDLPACCCARRVKRICFSCRRDAMALGTEMIKKS